MWSFNVNSYASILAIALTGACSKSAPPVTNPSTAAPPQPAIANSPEQALLRCQHLADLDYAIPVSGSGACYRELAAAYPNSPAGYYAKYISAEDPAEMLQYCNQGLAITSATPRQQARLYSGRGYAYLQLKNAEAARVDFQKAIALDPAYPVPYDFLADILIDEGNFDESIRLFRSYVAKYPRKAFGYLHLTHAVANKDEQRKETAAIAIEGVAKTESDHSMVYRADLFAAAGLYSFFSGGPADQAIAFLSESIQLAPIDSETRTYLVSIYLHKNADPKTAAATDLENAAAVIKDYESQSHQKFDWQYMSKSFDLGSEAAKRFDALKTMANPTP